jgi:hypothetical protein
MRNWIWSPRQITSPIKTVMTSIASPTVRSKRLRVVGFSELVAIMVGKI